jgi:carbon monoxide dehydrogenase subunit G
MPTVRRSRTVEAPPDAVWRVVSDPRHLPRWWPKVARVEGVDGDAFTKVLRTSAGRPVRADFRIVAVEPPRTRRWVQLVEGSPFERFLAAAEEAASVEPDGDGRARVTLEVRQRLRGVSRLGGPLVRRATRRQLDEALDALERVV